MSECRKHLGGWYGGPGWWCECGDQHCGYCGGQLVAPPPGEDEYETPDLVVITWDEYERLMALAGVTAE